MAFAQGIHRLRWRIVAVWAALIAVAFSASRDVVYDPDVLVYFDPSRPARQAFDAVEDRFGRSMEVVTLVVPRSGTVFSAAGVEAMARLAVLSAARPEVRAVRSPLSRIGVTPDEVLAADEAERTRLAGRLADAAKTSAAPSDPERALIAADGSVAAVAAIVRDAADNDATQRIAAAHRELRDRVATDTPGLDLIQTGRVVIDDAFLRESRDDVNAYAGVQIGILAALVFAALGSITLTLALLSAVIGITGGSVGVIALTGTELNGISSAAPAVLMGLMTASAIHVAIAWQKAVRDGASRVAAVASAFETNARPVVLSVLTTLVSFLVLNFAESPPFRQLGNIVAVGLVATLAILFTLLPALMTIVPPSRASHRAALERHMEALAGWVVRRTRAVLVSTVLVAVVAAVGVGSITIDDTFSHYFDESYEVRRATDLFEARLSGTTIVDVTVDTGAPGAALTPVALDHAARLADWLSARPDVARVDSVAALRTAAPASAEALVRAVDGLADEGGPRVLDATGRHLRFAVVMRGVSSRDTLAFAAYVQREADTLFGPGRAAVTGMPVLSAQLSVGSARSMIVGMVIALAVISAIIVVALRSVRLGLISLMPNLLPIAVAFGAWGYAAGEVSFAATVVGALTYGIVVDDTVHILAKVQRLSEHLPTAEAIRAAFRSVGVAVVVTSLALGLSFLPFALSGFLVNRHFGALTGLTLLAALVADLVFLPALLVATSRRKR